MYLWTNRPPPQTSHTPLSPVVDSIDRTPRAERPIRGTHSAISTFSEFKNLLKFYVRGFISFEQVRLKLEPGHYLSDEYRTHSVGRKHRKLTVCFLCKIHGILFSENPTNQVIP